MMERIAETSRVSKPGLPVRLFLAMLTGNICPGFRERQPCGKTATPRLRRRTY